MNTKQAAQKWGCSVKTVTKLCADGVIPLAEKDERGRWVIPDECEKPPVSRFRLCFLMDMINQLKEGVIFQQVKWGISEKELQDGYQYLIENAMVSSFDVHQLEKELPKATVTSRGKALMERENKEGSSQRKFNINFKINTSVFSFETGYENIVCAQPFGCLPNHIAGKGVVNRIRAKYPNANITAVDYDPSATKVNQENRIKLMLSVAKERLNQKNKSTEL